MTDASTTTRSGVRTLLSWVPLLAILAGCGSTNPSAFVATQAAGRSLARSERAAVWSLPIDARAADLVEFLDEDRVLVGEVLGGSAYTSPSYGPIRLLDAGSGRTLWIAPRNASPEMTHVLMATAPHLLFSSGGEGAGSIWALDAATGKRLWSVGIGGGASTCMSRDGSRLVILSPGERAGRLEAVDPRTGTRLWACDVEGAGPDVQVLGGSVLVSGASVRAFDLASGRATWDAGLPELGAPPRHLIEAPTSIVAWTARGMALIAASDGTVRWVQPVQAGGVKRLLLVGGEIYRIIGGPDVLDTDTIEALSAADGRLRWRRDTRGLVVSPLVAHRDLLAFTVEDALVVLKAGDGSESVRQDFDDAYAMSNPVSARFGGTPDVLALHGDLLVVDRDGMGLLAYCLPSGQRAWGTPALGRSTVDGAYQNLLVGLKVDLRSAPASIKMIDWPAPRPSAMALRAQQQHDETMRQTARTLGDPNASAGDRRSAIESRRLSTGLEISRTKVDIATERMMATAQAGLAAAEALVAIGQAVQRYRDEEFWSGLLVRVRMGLRGAIAARGTAFRGDVHVSGFSDGAGSGVRLVHLADGRVDEIRYEPTDPFHVVFRVLTEVAGLSPSGRQLVVVGLGLEAERYRSESSGGVTGVKASLLCFDPTQPKPVAPPEAPHAPTTAAAAPSSAAAAPPPAAMMGAISQGDVSAVRALLDAGMDPNMTIFATKGPPEFAYTPLRFAAASGKPEIVRLLLERGAKPTLEEVPGPTALDLASVTLDEPRPLAQARAEVRFLLTAAGARRRTIQGAPTQTPTPGRPDPDARYRGLIPHLYRVRRLLGDPGSGGDWKRVPLVLEALEAGQPKLALALLDRGCDVNAADASGRTALYRAVMQLDAGLVQDLLKRGADPNKTDMYGNTPLVLVLGPYSGPYGKPMAGVVELLLRQGADPNARIPDTAGLPAKTLLGAARAKSAELADLLRSHGARE
jgi:outer membrane protein assembly factor BamB